MFWGEGGPSEYVAKASVRRGAEKKGAARKDNIMDTSVAVAPVSPRSAVHAWQRYYGMEPREDSQLTARFVRGELGPTTADVIARELVCTDFLYQNTLYGEVIEDFMRSVAGSLRQKYGLEWGDTWHIVRFYGPVALKLMMMSACGLRMPNLHAPHPE